MKKNGDNHLEGTYNKQRSVGNDWRRKNPVTHNTRETKEMENWTHMLREDLLLID